MNQSTGLMINEVIKDRGPIVKGCAIINKLVRRAAYSYSKEILSSLPQMIKFDDIIEFERQYCLDKGIPFKFTMQDAIARAEKAKEEFEALGILTELILPEMLTYYDSEVREYADMILAHGTILFIGGTGIGKTAKARAACKIAGIEDNEVGYFSLPTLDPIDFAGIPSPDLHDDKAFYYRMLGNLSHLKVMILDETNRAHPKILNALMQLMAERRINDQHFPNLISIICCINPPEDGYLGAEELDPAVRERMDYFVKLESKPNVHILAKIIDPPGTPFEMRPTDRAKEVANAIMDWYKDDLSDALKKQLNPRRLQKIGTTYLAGLSLKYSIDKDKMTVPLGLLEKRLKSIVVFNMQSLLADPDAVESVFKQGSQEAYDYAVRFVEILAKMKSRGMKREFVQVAHLVNYLAKDQLPSYERNKALYRFCVTAIEDYATKEQAELWAEQIRKRSEGHAAIASEIAKISQRLNAEQDDKSKTHSSF